MLVGDIKRIELKPVAGRSMATRSGPVITDMKVIPVAGHDSMLLNIGGAHNAYFTRNIVHITSSAGHLGIGEAPGGEVIYSNTRRCYCDSYRRASTRLNKVVQQVHKGDQGSRFEYLAKVPQLELRVMPWRRWKPPC